MSSKKTCDQKRGGQKNCPQLKKTFKKFCKYKNLFYLCSVQRNKTKYLTIQKITIMENNSLNLLRDAMRVDFVNQVNLVRPNMDDLTTEWQNFDEYFKRSYLDEWRGEGGSDEDFNEYVYDLFNDIPNVLL